MRIKLLLNFLLIKMGKENTKEDKKLSFWKETHPIPTWLAILSSVLLIASLSWNIYSQFIERPTNEVIIADGPTADPHYNLSEVYTSKISLNFDGRYSSYYIEWKILDELGKSAGFEQIETCNRLGSLTEDKKTEEVSCKIRFEKYGTYKISINVYYVADEVKESDSIEKIEWLLNNGERSYPWSYEVYVRNQEIILIAG